MYRLPNILEPGSTIGVIAPSSAARRKYVEKGIEYLTDRGYRVKVAPNLSRRKFYLAGEDSKRVEYLEEFILDPKVDGIICVRGGYGLLRILDSIDFGRLTQIPPKVLVGYSDITALQMAMLTKLGWVSYTGPMVASEMGQDIDLYTEEWLWKVISAHPYPLTLLNPEEESIQVVRPGRAEGPLLAGCLSLITPLLGTEFAPSFENAILVVEDIGEKTYHIDKQFQMLRLHKVFEQISGLILGNFVNCFPKNPVRSFTMQDLIDDVLDRYNFPILSNFAYGHIRRRLTLPIGTHAVLSTDPLKLVIRAPQ